MRRTAPWLVVVLAALAHLLPTGALEALDRTPATPAGAAAASPGGGQEDSFPGAAYFLAEDAFAPVPAAGLTPGMATGPHILPLDNGPAPIATVFRAASPFDQARALQCLTNAIYYEAGNEPDEGQRAVAQVVLNRVASGRWPASISGPIYQGGERADRGCQFTFSCDGSMRRVPTAAGWTRARRVAMRALSGEVFAPAGLATFYHTLAVHPAWSETVRPVAVIGAHIFYRLPGAAGMAGAYTTRYAGREVAQPGPYAFIVPPRPPTAPPGPPMAWDTLPMVYPQPAPTPVTAPSRATAAPPDDRHGDEPALPESTIRPEYRNTGRPIS